MPSKKLKTKDSSEYQTLLRRVREILIEGQQKIEEERVRTYWKTGRHILSHLLKYEDRAEYGAQVL